MESKEREEGWMKGRKEEAKKGDGQRVARRSRKEGKGETDRQTDKTRQTLDYTNAS